MTLHEHSKEKNVYVVLGMARSGTSAIARGLAALGIALGDQLTPANEKWNPKGFFEDNDIVYKINRRVLAALDTSWVGGKLIDKTCYQHPSLSLLSHQTKTLLEKRMASTSYWGFKDPRTAKLLPFWQPIFSDLQLNEHYVFALRNPLSSARSYQRVSGVDLEVGLLLWAMHLIPAIEDTQNKNRVMVSYDAMMTNPRGELERIKKGLNLPALVDASEVDQYANTFLDKKLQHYAASEAELKAHPAVAAIPTCVKMYELFLKVANDELAFHGDAFLSEWHAIKAEFMQLYPSYCYMDKLLNNNKVLERELRTIRKSAPWKLIYPLRWIDDTLRSYRRQSRAKKRVIQAYE